MQKLRSYCTYNNTSGTAAASVQTGSMLLAAVSVLAFSDRLATLCLLRLWA
jgi:hypothetical protein